MDGLTVDAEPRNPNPTLTALLMDSSLPTPEDIELTLMEIDNDHLNNNFQFNYHNLVVAEQPQVPSQHPPQTAAQEVTYHSSESNSHYRTFDTNRSTSSPQRKCNCACAEIVILEQDPNGTTDNLLAEWLTRSARMIRTYPVLGSIDGEDMRTLLSSSWKELVILYMAQNDFDFDVHTMKLNMNAVCHHREKTTRKRRAIARVTTNIPSLKHVEQLKFILGKLRQMKLDSKEFALLRLLMLLNTDLRDLKNSNAVVKASEQIHMLLMEYETVCYASDPLRLSHMLLHLPGVRGFPILPFEQLFYRHLVGDTTVRSVLRELIET